jgi:putative iron-dependent peroxidase
MGRGFGCDIFWTDRMPQATLSQPITARLTGAAIFVVVTVSAGRAAHAAVRELCGDLSSLVRAVGFRVPDGELTCVLGIGANLWDRLFAGPRPEHLHPFREINGVHHAPSTPGDLLFHIRAATTDLCFELATVMMTRLDGQAEVVDEVHGFKYFDQRDLLGFVDGTENPAAQAAADAVYIGDEDPGFAGGSYVIVQKYLHDLKRWNKVPVHEQEDFIGRAKLSDIEQRDADKKPYAHNVLTNINDENGEQLQILRDNMPFGEIGKAEFGTYFIGYARDPARTERMLDNMFIGNPPGVYDRLLDFSTPVTGCLFFIPTVDFLDGVSSEPPGVTSGDGSLGVGSLRK